MSGYSVKQEINNDENVNISNIVPKYEVTRQALIRAMINDDKEKFDKIINGVVGNEFYKYCIETFGQELMDASFNQGLSAIENIVDLSKKLDIQLWVLNYYDNGKTILAAFINDYLTDEYSGRPIWNTIKDRVIGATNFLLENGADKTINRPVSQINIKDGRNGNIILMNAVITKNIELTKLFLEYKADIFAMNSVMNSDYYAQSALTIILQDKVKEIFEQNKQEWINNIVNDTNCSKAAKNSLIKIISQSKISPDSQNDIEDRLLIEIKKHNRSNSVILSENKNDNINNITTQDSKSVITDVLGDIKSVRKISNDINNDINAVVDGYKKGIGRISSYDPILANKIMNGEIKISQKPKYFTKIIENINNKIKNEQEFNDIYSMIEKVYRDKTKSSYYPDIIEECDVENDRGDMPRIIIQQDFRSNTPNSSSYDRSSVKNTSELASTPTNSCNANNQNMFYSPNMSNMSNQVKIVPMTPIFNDYNNNNNDNDNNKIDDKDPSGAIMLHSTKNFQNQNQNKK